MKLNVRKSAQGPVLAKGTVAVNDNVDCGLVDAMGRKIGCSYDTGNGTISGGYDPRNGGSVGIQYQTNSCC